MKAPLYNLIFVTALALYGTASYAQDLTVNFDATVEETTCAMTVRSLGSAAASGTSNDGYILTVPEMTVLDIVNQTSKAEGSFTNGMDLSVQFRRLTSTTPVAGTFQANATFSFTYK